MAIKLTDSERAETERPWQLDFDPEDMLLLVCARQQLTGEDERALDALLAAPLEWHEVVRRAKWHRLSGLVYRHLNSPSRRDSVPAGALEQLRDEYLQATAKYMYCRNELLKIADCFGTHAIPVIALKGTALVGSVYTEPGLRPMADMDLLVPDDQVHDAHALLRDQGYVAMDDAVERPEHWSLHQHLPILVGVRKPMAVELHRHIVRLDSPLAFDIIGFWDRAVEGPLPGVQVKALCAEDAVLHLCLNFFKDRRYYSLMALGQLCDIAEVLRAREDFDWPSFVERTRKYHVAGPVAGSLSLASRLLNAPVPGNVVRDLAPSISNSALGSFARRRVVTTTQWQATELIAPGERYSRLSLVIAMFRRVLPSREYMRTNYGHAGLRAYAKRLAVAFDMLGGFVRRPSDFSEDLSVDRWLHGLYEDETEADGASRPGADRFVSAYGGPVVDSIRRAQ